MSTAEWLLDTALASGADAAEVVESRSLEQEVKFRLGKLEGLERAENEAIGLRVLVGRRQATVSTNDMDKKSLAALAEQAVATARLAPEDPYIRLAEAGEYAPHVAADALELLDPNPASPEQMLDMAHEAEDAARAVAGISNSEGASASISRYEKRHITSKGLDVSYATSMASLSVSVLAKDDQGMQRDYDYAMRRWQADMPSPASIGKKAAERTLARCNPKKPTTATMAVVFDPRVAKGLLGAFASAANAQAVARQSSFLRHAMGEAIFPQAISIMDDPLLRRGLASRPVDGEGLTTCARKMVEDGVLASWFSDLATAAQLGISSSAHASRGLSSPPSPSPSNLFITAGRLSPKELMADIQHGLYVTETFGMGVNTVTGDYSQGAVGFMIENGEITHAVNEITIASTLPEIFASLTAANDLRFDYSFNSPSLRVENMMVAGA